MLCESSIRCSKEWCALLRTTVDTITSTPCSTVDSYELHSYKLVCGSAICCYHWWFVLFLALPLVARLLLVCGSATGCDYYWWFLLKRCWGVVSQVFGVSENDALDPAHHRRHLKMSLW